jgi:hypothetical protein
MKFTIGDSWADGHGQYETIYIECNKTHKELKEAYSQARAKTGINIEDECSEYQQNEISQHIAAELIDKWNVPESLITEDDRYMCHESFVQLWLWFATLADPTIEYKIVQERVPEVTEMGYGLFN